MPRVERQGDGDGVLSEEDIGVRLSSRGLGRRLHDLVIDQARRTPYALAVISGTATLDYRQLMAASSALAARLAAEGTCPDDRVAVLADRSADSIVALLGVLRSGAAYVPVDPEYPPARRTRLLEDAGVRLVVAPERLASAMPEGPWRRVDPNQPPADFDSTARTGNLAYLIYTSGSTGEPKAVAVEHRQIVHAITAQYAVERPWPEAFLMPISFSFDASAVGIYWTLTTGGCVILPRDGEHRDPDHLRELIQQYGVTHIDCTPSLYELVLGSDGDPVSTLRCVQVGGETCPAGLVARHRRLLPDCVFENNYGPTEATIWSTTNVIDPGDPVPKGRVPIGTAIPGAHLHVLDDDLAEVAPGVAGELYVGGDGVVRGYHDRPGQTAERFVPDPCASFTGRRVYRTGDLVRELPEGGLDFVGRRDGQVKVSGFRIELGEIEAVLRGHPAVAEAVVDVRPVGTEPALVGYLRLRDGSRCADADLVRHVAAVLPGHMVPRHYVRLSVLPVTVGGKVDRRSLPSVRAGDSR